MSEDKVRHLLILVFVLIISSTAMTMDDVEDIPPVALVTSAGNSCEVDISDLTAFVAGEVDEADEEEFAFLGNAMALMGF